NLVVQVESCIEAVVAGSLGGALLVRITQTPIIVHPVSSPAQRSIVLLVESLPVDDVHPIGIVIEDPGILAAHITPQLGMGGAVVLSVGPFFKIIDPLVVPGKHGNRPRHLGHGQLGVEGQLRFSFPAPFGTDYDHTVRAAGTVKGRCRSVLQNVDRLDVGRIQVTDRAEAEVGNALHFIIVSDYFAAVNYPKGVVNSGNTGNTPDPDGCRRPRVPAGSDYLKARRGALDQLIDRTDRHLIQPLHVDG